VNCLRKVTGRFLVSPSGVQCVAAGRESVSPPPPSDSSPALSGAGGPWNTHTIIQSCCVTREQPHGHLIDGSIRQTINLSNNRFNHKH